MVFLGHYASYKRGRVLHRDLSVNNLMIDWDRGNERHIGILSDWDLASLIDESNKVVPTHLKHRTGTVPFMSINLLSESPPPHRYFHDLESFFYILVWASVHFNIEEHRCERPQNKFLRWNSADLEAVSDTKTSFIMNPDDYESSVKEEFRELFNTWIDALRIMFHDAYYSREKSVSKDVTRSATISGRLEKFITFESFMAAIGREPRYTYTF